MRQKIKKKGVRLCAAMCRGGPALCGAVGKKKKGGPALCGAVRRGTGAVRRFAGKKNNFRLEFSFCGKRESGNSLFLESETPRILVLWKTRIRKFVKNENSRFMQNENPRILVLWKTRIGEFSFFGKSESENSRFVENETPRILVLWKTRIRRFVEKKKKRGPALCDAVRGKKKTKKKGGIRRCAALCRERDRRCAAVCGVKKKKKRGVRRCAALCRGGPALCGAVRKKKIQVTILVLWKTRIGEFSFSGKRDSKNSRFVENENSEICGKREFSFYAERESENSRFVENEN